MKTLFYTLTAATLALVAGCSTSSNPAQSAGSPAEAQSHYAKFGTNRVHYVVEGKGSHTIVLVHCWSGNLTFWHEQVPALSPKARLVLIDLPGHGQSDKPHTTYTMDFFAEAVRAVMRDAGVNKATLIGHSMGAPVICRVYKQAPEKVAALLSVDGFMHRPEMTREQADQLIATFRDPDYREKTRQFMGAMFPVPGTEAVRDWVISQMLETPQYVMLGAMDGMFNNDQPDWNPHHVNVPVLVINTPNRMWTDEYKQFIKSLSSQTDYRAFDGVGHWLMLEKPVEFNTALLDVLHKFQLIDK